MLKLFELEQNNPIKESLQQTNLTLVDFLKTVSFMISDLQNSHDMFVCYSSKGRIT